MRLRTTVFLWVVLLVGALLGATIVTVGYLLDRSARTRVGEELARSRDVTLDLHDFRQELYRKECRVLAEEPRLRAVVATEEITHETVLDAVQDLGATIDAGVFLITDAEGLLLADRADPNAVGFSLAGKAVVEQALTKEDGSEIWLADGKVYQVHGCRLGFGARTVGALVIGHAIDDGFADTVRRQTGGTLVLGLDGGAVTRLPPGATAAEVAAAMTAVRGGDREVGLGGQRWFAQLVSVPGYRGEQKVEYLLLRSIDEALAPARRLVKVLLVILGGAILATLALALLLARQLSRPIDRLVARTQEIAGGNFAPRPVPGPTEVRSLGTAMDVMAREIDESRRALADKERMARELEIAARVQTSILPRDLQVPGLEISARMVPAEEVGGDYYDVLPLERGCWLGVGDVSGHGLTAGLVMLMVQTGIASLVRGRDEVPPSEVLRALNQVIFDNVHLRLEAERHMTLSLIRYRDDGRLVVAGAHMDCVVWRAGSKQCDFLTPPGTWIAVDGDIDHVNVDHEWRLQPGDVLVVPTDGVTEAMGGAEGDQFGYERLARVLADHAGEPVAAIRDAMFAALSAHAPRLADDATIIVLRYVGTVS